jgi:hypothetical protein
MFKVCYRCPDCRVELEHPVIPHFASTLHLDRGLPCWTVPDVVVIASITDHERGPAQRGYVDGDEWKGDVWAIDSQWENPPDSVIQLICFPLPKEMFKK